MMDVRLTTAPVGSAELERVAAELGLERVERSPWTHGIVSLRWAGTEGRALSAGMDAASGAVLLVITDPAGELGERLSSRLPCETVEEVLAHAREAQEPRARIRAVHRLSTLLLATALPKEPVLDAMGAVLLDDEPLVRWAAARLLQFRADRRTEALLAAAVQRHDDLAPTFERVHQACEEAEDGTLHDGPTDDRHELLRRAREGVEAGQWRRVVRAMDALLAEVPDHEEGLLLRALAHEHAGEPLQALALAAAAQAEVEGSLDFLVRYREHNGDDRGSDEIEDKQAFLARVAEHRPRLEAALEALPGDGDEEVAAALVDWVGRWGYHTAARAAASRVLLERLPSIAGLLALEAGAHGGDVALLRRAVDWVPDAPECRLALARALEPSDVAAAITVYGDALRALEIPEQERSALAQRIADTRDSSTRASRVDVLEALARCTYEARRWDEAARHADALVELEPDRTLGWQIRANARIFGERLEEAAEVLADTLAALERLAAQDELGFGEDPRPGMRFNWSAVLAKLGRRPQALEQLRHAVRGDAKWGDEARGDDFFASLWDDADFGAIAAGEAAALILDEERAPGFIEGLVSRAIGSSHLGREEEAIAGCERAIALGGALGRADQVAKAHAVKARTQAFAGDLDEALEGSRIAMEGLERVSPDDRAEVVHTRGVVLHQARRFDEAEAAYLHAQAIRREQQGEGHPVLAKGFGDLARLAADRGDEPSRVAAIVEQGLQLLDGWLADQTRPRDDTWLEAQVDACTLQVNRGHVLRSAGELRAAVEVMEGAAGRIEELVGHGGSPSPAFLDNSAQLARTLAQSAPEPELRQRAQEVLARLETAQLDGSPEEIAERLFWRRLRSLARRQRALGVTDAAFAEVLRRALRGELRPQEIEVAPELARIPAEMSARTQRYPRLVVMAAMSLSLVESGGSSIDEALENLEELCVSSLYVDEDELS